MPPVLVLVPVSVQSLSSRRIHTAGRSLSEFVPRVWSHRTTLLCSTSSPSTLRSRCRGSRLVVRDPPYTKNCPRHWGCIVDSLRVLVEGEALGMDCGHTDASTERVLELDSGSRDPRYQPTPAGSPFSNSPAAFLSFFKTDLPSKSPTTYYQTYNSHTYLFVLPFHPYILIPQPTYYPPRASNLFYSIL